MDEKWKKAVGALEKGDFSRLEILLGGPLEFDKTIIGWYEDGSFNDQRELLAEALTCACMLGRVDAARFLLEKGVDPYAGMKTGSAGPHYAVGSGRLDVVQMLIEKQIPLEVTNIYGGTVLGQALWSAVNEHKEASADIIDALIGAKAVVESGSMEWWEKQNIASAETKRRIADSLRKAETP